MTTTTETPDRVPGGGALTSTTDTTTWSYCDDVQCSPEVYRQGLPTRIRQQPDDSVLEQQSNFAFDAHGNVVNVQSFGRKFVPTGPPTWTTPLEVSITYDAQDQLFPVRIANNLGHVSESVFDRAYGSVQYERSINGARTGYGYDAFGRLVYQQEFGGFDQGKTGSIELTRRYDKLRGESDSSGVYKVTEAVTGGNTAISAFDALGRVLYESRFGFEGTLRTVYRRYDRYGHLDAVSNPQLGASRLVFSHDSSNSTIYQSDLLGRPLAISTPSGNVRTFERDSFATFSRSQTSDAEGGPSGTLTGVNGEILASIDGVGTLRCFAYDASGALAATWLGVDPIEIDSVNPADCFRRAPLKIVRMHNDQAGRMQRIEDPELGVRSFSHDAFGRIAKQVDAKNQVSTFEYDALGRLISEASSLGTTTYQWDTWMKGLLSRVDGPWGSKAYVHDNIGRMRWSGEAHFTNPGKNDWTEFDFEFDQTNNGRLLNLTYPAPVGAPAGWARPKVNYNYTALGFLSAALNSDRSYAYWQLRDVDAFGASTRESWGVGYASGQNPNIGRVERYIARYPNTGLIAYEQTTKRNVWGQESWVDQTSFQYDLRGRITKIRDERASQDEYFTYDAVGHLTKAISTSWAGNLSQITRNQTMSYNRSGDLAYKSDVGSYVYGSLGSNPLALRSAGATTFDYDANGSMTRPGSTTFVYNGVDRLAEIWSSGSRSAKLIYDEAGSLIRRETAANGNWDFYGGVYSRVEAPYGVDNHYQIVAGEKVVAELTVGVNPSTYQAQWRMDLIQDDHRGSPRSVVRELTTGQSDPQVQEMSFDVWGRKRNPDIWASTSSSYVNTFGVTSGFTGHFEREDSGLIYMQARHYDPLLGRFSQPDSLIPNPTRPSGWSRYTYVDNDPVNWTDPSGHAKEDGGSKPPACPPGTTNCFEDDHIILGERRGDGPVEPPFLPPVPPGTGISVTGGDDPYQNLRGDEHIWHPPMPTGDSVGPSVVSSGGGGSGTLAQAENASEHSLMAGLRAMDERGPQNTGPGVPATDQHMVEHRRAADGAFLKMGGKWYAEVIAWDLLTGGLGYAARAAWIARAGRVAKTAKAVEVAFRLCFAAGTLVRTAEGLVPIEDVAVGDLVWSRDDESGEEGWREVTELFVTLDQEIIELSVSDAQGFVEVLRVTPGHPIWSLDDDEWDDAGALDIGERVETLHGAKRVMAVSKVGEPQTVYNFDVKDTHTYFVGESGIWVHNWCPGATLRGVSLKALQRAKPKGWRQVPTDRGSGWKWLDKNGKERLRFMRPNGKNPSASQWSRQSNGYFRWTDEAGNYLDIDGNVVSRGFVNFEELTHIMYEGL
jgi:RHS repeat-associated protein